MSELQIRIIAAIVGVVIGFGCGAYYGYLTVFKKLLAKNFYGDDIKRENLSKPTPIAIALAIIFVMGGIVLIACVVEGFITEVAIAGMGVFLIVMGGIIIWGALFGK